VERLAELVGLAEQTVFKQLRAALLGLMAELMAAAALER
jgi:hypothetical protein